jgi:hypothetical protein
MKTEDIFEVETGTFFQEYVESIMASISGFISMEEIEEIVLLNTSDFSIENFLEIKSSIIKNELIITKTDYSFRRDILFFYQVVTTSGKTYAIAHRDPFEIYFNQAIMWFYELPHKFSDYPVENVLYKRE